MEIVPPIVPPPDAAAEPEGFVVEVRPGERIHFLDWGDPPSPNDSLPVLLIHGLSNTAWSWAPVARRLAGSQRVIAMDLRGHGLSDAATDGYDAETMAADVTAVAEGSGLIGRADDRVVLVGHGFGAIVAAWSAAVMGARCAGLLLVDGGWESLEVATGMDIDEFLRGLDEPPEIMRTLGAYLADRKAFDPSSWDADQDRAARATVVETQAGRVVPATRPHVTLACVRAMFGYEPTSVLSAIAAPIAALVAVGVQDDLSRSRKRALEIASAARVASGRKAVASTVLAGAGHNLMRYRPDEVAAVISVASRRDQG